MIRYPLTQFQRVKLWGGEFHELWITVSEDCDYATMLIGNHIFVAL